MMCDAYLPRVPEQTEEHCEVLRVLRDLQAFAAGGGWPAALIPREPSSDAAFLAWLTGASTGDALQYHVGLLTRDRGAKWSPLRSADRQRLDALATRVWQAAERGLVHPFSQRDDAGTFHYLAIRSSRPLNDTEFLPAPSPQAPIFTTATPTRKEINHEPA